MDAEPREPEPWKGCVDPAAAIRRTACLGMHGSLANLISLSVNREGTRLRTAPTAIPDEEGFPHAN